MKRKGLLALSALIVLVGASLKFTQTAFSSSHNSSVAAARAFAAPVNPFFVTNLNVNRTDDTAAASACAGGISDCSLRGAIINANADMGAPPIVINLQAGTTYNLTLTNGSQENSAATGDLDITTTLHSVTIVGGGPSTIINAAGLNSGSLHDRAFQITGATVNATFQDLTIENGTAADDGANGASTDLNAQNANRSGGCILNNGGSVTLTNVVLQSCHAIGKGDTVLNDHTTLDAHGGGLASLAATGNVFITGTTFTGNTALGGNGNNFNNGAGSNAAGGSIYFEGGTLNIDGSRIDNSAANGGNGGSVSTGTQKNGGNGGFAQGGGAWVGAGTVTINNTTFENTVANGGNSGHGDNGSEPAGDAGGGSLYSLGTITVTNSTFDKNSATGGRSGDTFGPDCFASHESLSAGAARGGAILADGGSLIIDTATFNQNSAHGGNGGDGGPTNTAICAQSQHGDGGLAYGGAITNTAATLNIKHSTISGNIAQAGNSGVNQAGATLPPRPVAEGTGGGIRVGPGTVTLENTIIAGNGAANGAGDGSSAPTPGADVDGTITSNGHNLLDSPGEAVGFTGPDDQVGVNAMLHALANNGGPTKTMALSPTSPAIDAGIAAGATTDQRGQPRTIDDPGVANAATSDGTDIGAYEAPIPCILTCPGNISVSSDTDDCGAVVTYTTPGGSGCGTVTCDHPSGSFFGIGPTALQCTSSAGPTCSFTVTVVDDTPPSISCPPNIIVDAIAGTCAAPVTFTVGANDNCSVPTVGLDHASGSSFPVGTTTVHATATDAAGNSSACTFTVTVKDITPPVINLIGNTIALWPPNHKHSRVNVTDLVGSASDLCDPSVNISSVVIASVSSDEPNNSGGDGNTTNDIVIAPGCKSVQLRAERMGGSNGRVYTITFKVTDGSGNSTTATAKVVVDHSQNGSGAIDDGPQYTVNGCP
jgi:HYR domain